MHISTGEGDLKVPSSALNGDLHSFAELDKKKCDVTCPFTQQFPNLGIFRLDEGRFLYRKCKAEQNSHSNVISLQFLYPSSSIE